LVFTGGLPAGSLNALNHFNLLTHEPTTGVATRTGCCGGNGTINLYQLIPDGTTTTTRIEGDYQALAAVPEPATITLLALGLAILLGLQHNRGFAADEVRNRRFPSSRSLNQR
jgi:hypothetical protein